MLDRLPAPPRRPAPLRLRERIARELGGAPVRRFRPRAVLVPLLAASVVGAVMIAGGLVGARLIPDPVQSATPYSVSASPTAARSVATPSVTPTPAQPVSLDLRAMTKGEIKADGDACLGSDPMSRHRGKPKAVYAMVQHRAGLAGPLSGPPRIATYEWVIPHPCADPKPRR